MTPITSGNFEGGYALQMSTLGLGDEYPKLVIIFTAAGRAVNDTHKSVGGFVFDKSGYRIIVIPCLLKPHDTTYLSTRFGAGGKKPFVHEFMHYLMSYRKPRDLKVSATAAKAGDMAGYYNDADETNAHYQEAVQDATELFSAVVRTAPLSASEEWLGWTTQQFMNYVKRVYFDKDFLAHITPKVRRALDKRLARWIETTIRPMIERAHEK